MTIACHLGKHGRMKIMLPNPALVLLIGISGSGKSTFAHEYFAPTEVVSSDHCRALVCDDENDQSVNQAAFEILHLIAASRLTHRKLTVIDATNVQAEARAHLLRIAQQRRIPAVAVVFNFALELCLQRNTQRLQRVVPSEVIQQQYADLQHTIRQLPGEGLHSIYTFDAPSDVAAITILRKKSRRRKSDLQ